MNTGYSLCQNKSLSNRLSRNQKLALTVEPGDRDCVAQCDIVTRLPSCYFTTQCPLFELPTYSRRLSSRSRARCFLSVVRETPISSAKDCLVISGLSDKRLRIVVCTSSALTLVVLGALLGATLGAPAPKTDGLKRFTLNMSPISRNSGSLRPR